MNERHSYDVINCSIIRNGKTESGRTVKVRKGRIVSIERSPTEWIDLSEALGGTGADEDPAAGYGTERVIEVIDADGHWLVPGFVELHIHGCGDLSLEQDPDDGAILDRTACALEKYGINTFLPTLQANEAAISRLGDELAESPYLRERVPGLYIEGPFVHPEKRGGILPEHIGKPDPGILKRMQEKAGGAIRLMTVAPELEGIDRIMDLMDDLGIIPCFGHSTAAAETARAAAGDRNIHLTHLFNAMSSLSHREPGLAMLPFLSDILGFELNGDGVHVHPDMLRMCWRHLNRKKMVLISDAVVSSGSPPGEYAYFGKEVVSGGDGVRYKDNGVLIGSHLLIPQIAAVFANTVGAGVPDIIPLVTENPLALLIPGENSKQEPLRCLMAEGAPADLVLIDDDFTLLRNFNPYSRSAPAP